MSDNPRIDIASWVWQEGQRYDLLGVTYIVGDADCGGTADDLCPFLWAEGQPIQEGPLVVQPNGNIVRLPPLGAPPEPQEFPTDFTVADLVPLPGVWVPAYLREFAERLSPVPDGLVVVHNSLNPPPGSPGSSLFKAWLQAPNDRLVPCGCGWAPELGPHYRVRRDGDPQGEAGDRQQRGALLRAQSTGERFGASAGRMGFAMKLPLHRPPPATRERTPDREETP